MNWTKGFRSSFYSEFIDPSTWARSTNEEDGNGRFKITGGSIQRREDSLRQTASINCIDYGQENERWIRVWMDTRQGEDSEHVALFTGLANAPSRNKRAFSESTSLQCYSVLKPLEDMYMPLGWYAYEGTNPIPVLKTLLKPSPAPIIVETEEIKPLSMTIVAEQGETNLSMIDYILIVIDWRMQVDGYGRIHLGPLDNAYLRDDYGYTKAINTNIIEQDSLYIDNDWYQCPNVFRATSGDLTAVARDDDPDSVFSTISRGREIWMEESDCKLNDGENLAEYATRRLSEEQRMAYTATYDRRFDPDVNVGDILRIHVPASNIDGNFLITSQTIDLSYGASTSEEAEMI